MPRQILKLKRPAVRIDDAKDPETWRIVGRRLLKGAKLAWQPLVESVEGFKRTRAGRTADETREFTEQADYFSPFFVLAGLAVENFLKARIVERRLADGVVFSSGMDVLREFPTKAHDLVKLARLANPTVPPRTEALLKRLSEYVTWAGRYPIPLKASDASIERITRENDLEDIEAFIASL